MRRIARPPVEVFSLSFLDIISCAFGAIVMLVLLSKNGDLDSPPNGTASDISTLIDSVLSAKRSLEELTGALSNKEDALLAAKASTAATSNKLENLEKSIPRALKTLKQLENKAQTIRDEIRLTNAMLNTPASTTKPDEDVGGVPTDADYVIFIIDNSGSMQDIGWNLIIDVVSDVINNHPDLKGFHVMNAGGDFLPVRAKPGSWIRDSKANRREALIKLERFSGGSSNPQAGIKKAIRLYKNQKGKVSLYVFGDEYRGNISSEVKAITDANYDPSTKSARFRIHGIGFYWNSSSGRDSRPGFASLMKEVAYNNRGSFIALDVK